MVSFLMGDLAGLSAGLTSAEDTKAWSSFLGDVRQDESAADGILSSSHARHVDTNTNAKPSLSLVVGNSPSASSSSSFVERHVPLVKDRSSDLLNKGHLVGSSKAAGLSARSHIEEATGSPLVPKSASSSFLQYNHSDAVSSTTSSGGLHLLHDHDSARAGHTDLSSPSGSSALMRLAHGHELSSTDHDILRHHIQVLARGQHAHPHDTSFLLMGSGNSTISRAAAAYPMPTDFSALSLKDLFYVAKTGFLLFGGLCSKMFGMGLIGFLAFQSMTAPKSELPRPYTAYYPQPVLYPHVYSDEDDSGEDSGYGEYRYLPALPDSRGPMPQGPEVDAPRGCKGCQGCNSKCGPSGKGSGPPDVRNKTSSGKGSAASAEGDGSRGGGEAPRKTS